MLLMQLLDPVGVAVVSLWYKVQDQTLVCHLCTQQHYFVF